MQELISLYTWYHFKINLLAMADTLKYFFGLTRRSLLLVLLLPLSACDVLYRNQAPAPVSGPLGGGVSSQVPDSPDEHETKRSYLWSGRVDSAVKSPDRPDLEPSLTFKQASAPVVALISEAERNITLGSLDIAAATVERAMRIEPRNGHIFIKLAEIRIKQGKAVMAEQLAEKTLSLSQGKNALKKRCWLLIAKARHLQGNQQGAAQAEQRARQY